MSDRVADAKSVLGDVDFGVLGVKEFDGILYLPIAIRKRGADGKPTTDVDVWLCSPTPKQRRLARTNARQWALKEKLDLDRDKDEVDELENFWIMTFAIRDKQTRSQLEETAESLTKRFGHASLKEVAAKLGHWGELLDPRYGEMNTEQLWQLIAQIAVEGNLSPLVATPGFEQSTCIVFMARAACVSPSAPSWLSSAMSSRFAPSTVTPSTSSSVETTGANDPSGSAEAVAPEPG